ncbi:MAG: ABC transporter ATP-binding protein [Acutalibacteraceae bacterium]
METTQHSHFDSEDIMRQEQNFIDYYTVGEKRPLRLLFKLYRGHYRHLLLSALFFVLKVSPTWVMPIATANVINIATQRAPGTAIQIVYWVALELFLVAMNVPTHYLHIRFYSLATRSVEAGLRGAMVRKLQQLSIGFHKEMESGRIQSKVMRDVEAIEAFSSQVLISLFSIILNLAVALTVVFTTNRTVFLFFILCAPVGGFTVQLFRKNIRRRNREFRQEIERTSAEVMDMVELIPVTRAHALENKEIRRMTEQLNTVAEKGFQLDLTQNMFTAASWVVFQTFQLICLGTTSFFAFNAIISVGEIALYQSYFGNVVGQVSQLMQLLPTLTKGTESILSVGEILAAHDIEDNAGKKRLKHLDGVYEFRDVCFQYDDRTHVLDHFNLTVQKGETVALVGESGAGKSTVLNIVIGFNKPTSGRVLIDGQDIHFLDLHAYRKFIAVVPQTSILFNGTIRDNITYGLPSVSEEQLAAAVEAANLTELIQSLPDGLDTLVGEHGGKLSGGQRQRISIARAIIRDPRVIVFDEATSALDSISEKQIQTAINNLTRDRTTFIVAHRLSTIRDADKIAVLREGKCVEFGTYDELMAKQGEFYKMKVLQS